MIRIIIILLSVSGLISAQQNNTLDELNINGNVKTLLYSEFDAIEKFGKPVKGEIGYVDKSIFNENGYNTQIITYRRDGNPLTRKVYEYNDYGDISIYLSYLLRNSNTKRLTPSKPYKHVFVYKYDNKNNIIEDNRLINNSGSYFKGRNVYVYDGKGNAIKKTSYNWAEELSGIRKYVYDLNGNLIERTIVKGEGSLYHDGKVYPSREKYKYNSFNNLVETANFGYTGTVYSVESWKYEKYDERSNWVKAILYVNQISKLIVEREIEYYE